MANTMDKLREMSVELRREAEHHATEREYGYEYICNAHAERIDAIVRESDAQAPVAATLDDAAADPALTLDVARELLRDAAAGIRSLAASATSRTKPRSTHRVHRGNEWLPCYCAADFDHKVGHEQERVEAAEGREAVRGSTLRFGLGAWIVNTGTYAGEPCVFIDDAPTWGKVGERAPDVPQGVKPFIRLLFPTAEQATAVQLALTTPLAGDGARVTDEDAAPKGAK